MTLKEADKILKEAIIQFNRKNFDEAKAALSQVLDVDPTNPEANYYLGLIYAKNDNHKKAVIYLKSIVDMDVNFLFTQQCRMILGYIYYKNMEFKRAEREFLEVMKSNLNILQVNAALSAIYYKLGDKDKAIQFAEKAFEYDPYNLNAKNSYGYLLCEYDLDVPKGLEILREVVRVNPTNAAYIDSLGWAYYKKGDVKAAIASLKRAISMSNGNEEIKEHYDIVLGKK